FSTTDYTDVANGNSSIPTAMLSEAKHPEYRLGDIKASDQRFFALLRMTTRPFESLTDLLFA
ncbi:MAG: hypothetical protein DME94_11505, partial [Verrucomicrobia bacterium]